MPFEVGDSIPEWLGRVLESDELHPRSERSPLPPFRFSAGGGSLVEILDAVMARIIEYRNIATSEEDRRTLDQHLEAIGRLASRL